MAAESLAHAGGGGGGGGGGVVEVERGRQFGWCRAGEVEVEGTAVGARRPSGEEGRVNGLSVS